MKNRIWNATWSPFHISFRQTWGAIGPAGLGLRLFHWRPDPRIPGRIFNVEFLLGPWDLQLGIHTHGSVEAPPKPTFYKPGRRRSHQNGRTF